MSPAAQVTTAVHLPVQLLMHIMTLLGPQDRLQCAAPVSRSWLTAAAMATNTVHVHCVSQEQTYTLPSLSRWLSAHGDAAAVRSVTVYDAAGARTLPEPRDLQLPTKQLWALEELLLSGAHIAAVQDSSSAAPQPGNAAPLMLSDLTALTSLELSGCKGWVDGLAGCTALQHLVLVNDYLVQAHPCLGRRLAAQLTQALPALTHLTHLVLAGSAIGVDESMQHISALTRLQDLTMRDSSCSRDSFQQLPQSISGLVLHWELPDPEGGHLAPVIEPGSTPGICQLTGLKALEIQHVAFDLEVLTGLTGLQQLMLKQVQFFGEGTLSVLAALKQLQHLELPDLNGMMLGPADVAAATASRKLTYLDIGDTFDAYAQHHDLFPGGKQLPQLVELHAHLGMMNMAAGRAAAACCPNLQRLQLVPGPGDEFHDADEGQLDEAAVGLASMLRGWQQVHSLTSLTLSAGHRPMDLDVWAALSGITQLCKLDIHCGDVSYLPGMLNLSRCTRLTELHIKAFDAEEFQSVTVSAQADKDDRTPVHLQLPQKLQDAVLGQLQRFGQRPRLVEGLLKATAALLQNQQQADEALQAQVDGLQQRVGVLEAGLAAALKQLQGTEGAGA